MPHRVTTIKRYRVSNDVLMLILGKLDPVSLYKTCQAFQRVYELVIEFQHLRYKFELAVVGMKDGPHSVRGPLFRLQLLLAYKKDWPRLHWTDEQKIPVPANATQVDVSGNFLYYVGNQSLNLIELPSCRTGLPPSQTQYLQFNTSPQADCVAIDSLQSLVVASQTYAGPGGQIGLRLKIRDLRTFDKHPNASSPYYDCSTHVTQPVSSVSIVICGSRIIVTLEFAGGLTKHLLMDWSTFQAMWMEEQDVILLNAYHLLGVRKVHGKIMLYLYNIYDMRNVAIEREYELPPIWAKSTMRFGRNTVPNNDVPMPSNVLFYPDPSARVLLLMAKQTGPTGNGMHWMFINESFFRRTSYADRRSVPWSYWNQFCLIKEIQNSTVVGIPQVVGNRIIYIERDGTCCSRGYSRLSVIDFSPNTELTTPLTKMWTLIGKMSILRPIETYRDFPSATTQGLPVERICATEDNIVVLLENRGDIKPVNILTFGVPRPRHDNQYHPSL
ncbi:hypothetical protein CPB84DRAFT_1675794 [Gymnopilus junonius]|uniref:F-box domain-containing protein n=1 Tax=Gymnopilus junonius TaxID=109634 RepID=A0A9P5NW59_GYMJU|nr:hypothetical protein CPB84DRAFT_1675794 [Gymnopilus junonius]